MEYNEIIEIMDQERESQPMASEEVRSTYSVLYDALDAYITAVQKDSFYFGYITALKRLSAESEET